MSKVRLLARWTGWCDPCESERPLLLTETGERGVRAWLHGAGPDDRELTLTCGVCGEWQDVLPLEDEEADVDAVATTVLALQAVGTRQVLVHAATPSRIVEDPAPVRHIRAVPYPAVSEESDEAVFGLLTEGMDLIAARAG